ncbi:putative membrane protein AbrB (regulator of aidB expression) [Microvirga flocculans]|uniref:Putative membrane protein AbrB (Regulator of aidB expression) n=1 Tax=Microvirga flocculans TaxID=217168 RepID=A0A7W6IIH7_9HYPH|nr:VanZ family protein [Microvirga flocculans]MBB4042096.1 putative membrane protein AbrB (regulator of aidB expression) [Microvirga flocculans]
MSIRSVSRWLAWLLVFSIAIFTLAPIEFRPVTAAPADWERFAAFLVIGGLFCIGYPQHRLQSAVLLLGVAMVLEGLQYLTPGRHGRVPDGLIKAVGALLGIALGAGIELATKRLMDPHGFLAKLRAGQEEP